MLRVIVQAVMKRFTRLFKCLAACEVLPWPVCGWPSNTFKHPKPSEASNEAYCPLCCTGKVLTWISSRALVMNPCPGFWRLDSGKLLLFYQVHVSVRYLAIFKQNQEGSASAFGHQEMLT